MKSISFTAYFVHLTWCLTIVISTDASKTDPVALASYKYPKPIIDTETGINSTNQNILIQMIIPNYVQLFLDNEEIDPDKLFNGTSRNCRVHVEEFGLQLKNGLVNGDIEPWALQMIDAWAKFPEGILSGHAAALGDFDECLKIRFRTPLKMASSDHKNSQSDSSSEFKGKYCYSHVTTNFTHLANLPVPNQFQVGTCYPSSCSKEDVTILQTNAISIALIEFPIISHSVSACYTDDKPEFSPGDIIMIVVLTLLVLLSVVGTSVDLFYNSEIKESRNNAAPAINIPQNGMPIQILVAFSVRNNTMKWISTKSARDNFACIHGIRFFTTCWIILLHTWSMVNYQPIWNMVEVHKMQQGEGRWTILSILNGFMAVDTFFTIGGLLVSFSILKMLDKSNGRINIPKLYLHRYLRLTPAYALLVGIMATWFRYLRTGPGWVQMDQWASFCTKNWWHNILYINNLWNYSNVGDDNLCHGDSWYLADDMQFFILSPFLVYPLWRWRKAGLILMGLVSMASIVVPIVITYHLDLIPTFLPLASLDQIIQFTKHGYMVPWMRIGPYMVGLWTGYLLYQIKKGRTSWTKLPKLIVHASWCVSTAAALTIVFGLHPYYSEDKMPTLFSAFYAGFHRFVWGMVISWVIIACTLGYGGWINTFLSWNVFIPLGKLTFCTYLMAYSLQLLFHYSVRQAISYDSYYMTNIFFAHVVMSFMIGFVCHITMESPFLVLEKIIFSDGSHPSELLRLEEVKHEEMTTIATA